MRGEYLLNDGSHARKREMRLTPSPTFALEKAVGDRRQDHVALPARKAAAFEMIEPDLVLEFLVLLLDGPPLMRETNQRAQRGGGREVYQVVADAIAARQIGRAHV